MSCKQMLMMLLPQLQLQLQQLLRWEGTSGTLAGQVRSTTVYPSLSVTFPSVTVGVVTPLSSHSRRMEKGDVACSSWMAEGPISEIGEWGMKKTSSPPRVKNEEWRKLLVEGFIIFHMRLLLSPGIHITKSAWWLRQWTSNPSMWIEHKILPHAGGNSNSHFPFSILHRPQRGVTPFFMEKLSYWLLFFLILHSPFSHSPFFEEVWQP